MSEASSLYTRRADIEKTSALPAAFLCLFSAGVATRLRFLTLPMGATIFVVSFRPPVVYHSYQSSFFAETSLDGCTGSTAEAISNEEKQYLSMLPPVMRATTRLPAISFLPEEDFEVVELT